MKTKSRILAFLGLAAILVGCSNSDTADFSTIGVGSISYVSAHVRCPFTIQDDAAIEYAGICWSESENPTINDNMQVDSAFVNDVVTSVISGLYPNTNYYVRAFVKTASGISYSASNTFKTQKYELIADTVSVDSMNFKISYTTRFVYPLATLVVPSDSSKGLCLSLSKDLTLPEAAVERTSVKPSDLLMQAYYLNYPNYNNSTWEFIGFPANTKFYYRVFSKTTFGYYYSKLDSLTTHKTWAMLHP